jgi:PKD repeat protein
MGSIALNGLNEIGLGYSISSTTVYPGIRYCGQSASAYATGAGVLDVAEAVIQTATTAQSSYNRWGDYSAISIDPDDDHTFWFTTQYGGSRQTKIASFQFTPPSLTANFSGTPTSVCAGGTVTFTDQSVGGPTSWNWSFPGGTPSSSDQQNPTNIVYYTAGIYDVTLTVTNTFGSNTITKSGYITVDYNKIPEFKDNLLSVYPNPSVNGKFFIQINGVYNKTPIIMVTDIKGNKINLSNSFQPNMKSFIIDIKNQAKGTYLLFYQEDKRKVVKQLLYN